MVAITSTKMTFADFMALEETNQIVELIDGEIIVTTPLDVHQQVLCQLVLLLASLVKHGITRFAPTGVYFDDFNTFEPDLFWVSPENARCVLGPDKRVWRGAPDLIVEVLSPSTAYRDRGDKFHIYEKYGVREYWMIDPDAQFVEVYRLDDNRYARAGIFGSAQSFTSDVLGGIQIETAPLFA